jgi:serine/threonine-protein kinase RsbW
MPEPVDHQHLRITREGQVEHLPEILRFVDRACEEAGVEDEAAFALHLAVEEVCTNIIQHGYAGGHQGSIELAFSSTPGGATITITDEAPHFAPEQAPAPDLDSDWEERRIGGLGLYLVYQLMDEVHYEPAPERGNRLTLIKRFATT